MFVRKKKKKRELSAYEIAKRQRQGLAGEAKKRFESFCEMLQVPNGIKASLLKVFQEFDEDHDGSVDLDEFREQLGEPKRRHGLLRRLFCALDEDGMKAEVPESNGTHILDMFEFAIGFYSVCTLPKGDYIIRFLWDLYDPKGKGRLSESKFRCLLRESMSIALPETFTNSFNHTLQGVEAWTSLQVGDLALRIDVDGYRHACIVRETASSYIVVQDVYCVDHPFGLTQGTDNSFKYIVGQHKVKKHVKPLHIYEDAASDDEQDRSFKKGGHDSMYANEPFDERVEQFLVVTADRNDDGYITLKEFRRLLRRRLSQGQASPYSAMTQLQQKFRRASKLSESFWEHQSVLVLKYLENSGLWSALELYRIRFANVQIPRPPQKYGGERPDNQSDKDNFMKRAAKNKPRRTHLEGEDALERCAATSVGSSIGSRRASLALIKQHELQLAADREADLASLTILIRSASGLAACDFLGKSDPFCHIIADDKTDLGTTPVQKQCLHPVWDFPVSQGKRLRVPHKLEFKLWDSDGKKKPNFLGSAILLRSDIRSITKQDIKKPNLATLKLLGELDSGAPATGTLSIEMQWHDPQLDVAPAESTVALQTGSVNHNMTSPSYAIEKVDEESIAADERSPSDDKGTEISSEKSEDDGSTIQIEAEQKKSPSNKLSQVPKLPDATQWLCSTSRDSLIPQPGDDEDPIAAFLHKTYDDPHAASDPMHLIGLILLSRRFDPSFKSKEAARLKAIQNAAVDESDVTNVKGPLAADDAPQKALSALGHLYSEISLPHLVGPEAGIPLSHTSPPVMMQLSQNGNKALPQLARVVPRGVFTKLKLVNMRAGPRRR